MKKVKKLTLKKQTIADLTNSEMNNLQGGAVLTIIDGSCLVLCGANTYNRPCVTKQETECRVCSGNDNSYLQTC